MAVSADPSFLNVTLLDFSLATPMQLQHDALANITTRAKPGIMSLVARSGPLKYFRGVVNHVRLCASERTLRCA